MKPPDDRPETVVWALSTLSLGRGTAAVASGLTKAGAIAANAATARKTRAAFMGLSPGVME
jgi:hypothetical protein